MFSSKGHYSELIPTEVIWQQDVNFDATFFLSKDCAENYFLLNPSRK